MGQEASCVLRRAGAIHSGKALLETSELIFRGESVRLKIPFSSMTSVTAQSGELRFQTPDGAIRIELGAAAEKWREKILHPKTRIEKLGVKPGASVRLLGKFDADFVSDLKASARGPAKVHATGRADWIFLAVEEKGDLGRVASARKKLRGATGLWIVYPKGQKTVRELDVISAGRKAGLKDVKVVGFSATHTALKFVVPLEKR